MEPNNIEDQFREKLNNRAIQPSANSWDRLDAMLTVADPSVSKMAKQKPKRNFRWMYFAASFLGFILIATVFFSQTEDAIDSEHQKVVLQEKTIEIKENDLEDVVEKPMKTNTNAIVSASEKTIKVQKDKEVVKRKSNAIIAKEASTQLAINTANSENKIIKTPIITRDQNSNLPSHQKTEVKVNASSLLASVENNQASKSRNDAVAISVNTNELLSQVDGELELSFREKVIKSVNKTYREVKVAVIKRNLE